MTRPLDCLIGSVQYPLATSSRRYLSTDSVGLSVSERKPTKVGISNFQNGNWLKGQARPFPLSASKGGFSEKRAHSRQWQRPTSLHVSKPGGIGHPGWSGLQRRCNPSAQHRGCAKVDFCSE